MKIVFSRRSLLAAVAIGAVGATRSPAQSALQDGGTLRAAPSFVGQMPLLPTVGASAGDITVAEFFDYRCPYCRAMQAVIAKALAEDAKLRVVFVPWPIFGGVSIEAAKVALAAGLQGKFLPVHEALFKVRGPLEHEALLRTARSSALDMDRLESDLNARNDDLSATLVKSNQIARALQFNATPSLLIGTDPIPGALSYEDFTSVIAGVRKLVSKG